MRAKNQLTFAEAAKQRADKRFKVEIAGMPDLYVRLLSARESRLLRTSCLRDGKTPDDLDQPGALDEDAYMIALLAASCQNEDGSAAFPGGEQELLECDEPLLAQIGKQVVKVITDTTDSGNA
jgi:hypothetical protein